MKSGTLVAAVLLALVAGNLAAGNSMAGEISKGSLAKMGLAGVQKMSDREGKQVRGTGSSAAISGLVSQSGARRRRHFNFGNGATSSNRIAHDSTVVPSRSLGQFICVIAPLINSGGILA